jgi:hypothetical protein
MAWELLISNKLTGTNTNLDSGTFTAKKFLYAEIYTTIGSGTPELRLKFSGDTSSDYANRYAQNFASQSTNINSGNGIIGISAIPKNTLTVMYAINIEDEEKLVFMQSVQQNNTGAGNIISTEECFAKWANTSDSITSFEISSGTGGDWGADSEIVIWGTD